jgi:hypothetical protein
MRSSQTKGLGATEILSFMKRRVAMHCFLKMVRRDMLTRWHPAGSIMIIYLESRSRMPKSRNPSKEDGIPGPTTPSLINVDSGQVWIFRATATGK